MGNKANRDCFISPSLACYGNRWLRKYQASLTTLRTYDSWWQLFYTAAVTSFEWEGLPDCIDARYLETVLFFNGTVALTRTSPKPNTLIPYVVAPYSSEGKLDCYNNPNKVRLLTANGQRFTRYANYWLRRTGNQHGTKTRVMVPNACVCWDSVVRWPLYNTIDLACRRLAEFDVTIDQHVRAERVPYIFTVPEEGRANAEEMFNKIEKGDPAMYFSPAGTQIVTSTVLNTGIDYIGDKLLNDELKLVSQTYTLLGIDNNAAAEKKERVQTAETVANNEQFLMQRRARLRAREEFCEDMRRVFGLDVHVRWAVPHVWEDGQDMQYNPALETSAASAKYGTSRGLFFGSNTEGDPDGNALR